MLYTEVSILALYGVVVALAVVVQVLLAIPNVGISYLASPRDERRAFSGLAGRAKRAADNSFIAMAYFAPAALAVHVLDRGGSLTLVAAQLFLAARIVYIPLYVAGVPWLRTGVWILGFLATLYLYLALLV